MAGIYVEQCPDHIALGVFGVQQCALHVEPAHVATLDLQCPLGTHRALQAQALVQRCEAVETVAGRMQLLERALRLERARGKAEALGCPGIGVDDAAAMAGDKHQGASALQQGAHHMGLLHPFLDIGVHSQHAQCLVVGIAQGHFPARFDPSPGAIGLPYAHLDTEWVAVFEVAPEPFLDARLVQWVQQMHEAGHGERTECLVRHAQHLVAAGIPHHLVVFAVPLPKSVTHGTDGQPQPLLALVKRLAQAFVLGDIEDVAMPEHGCVVSALRACMALQPAHGAIGGLHAVLAGPVPLAAHRFVDGPPERGDIFRMNPLCQVLQGRVCRIRIDAVHGIKAGVGKRQSVVAGRVPAVLEQAARHFLRQEMKALFGLDPLVLLPPALERQPGRQHPAQKNQQRAYAVAPQALPYGLVERAEHGLVVQPRAHQYRKAADAAPGIHALYSVGARQHLVGAMRDIGGKQRHPLRGQLAPEHPVLVLRACKIGAVLAQQQDHVARAVEDGLQLP